MAQEVRCIVKKDRNEIKKEILSFIEEHKWCLIVFGIVCIFVIGYIVIYFAFSCKGFIPAGVGMEKNDWLSFLGAYLSFAGTVSVAIVAALQSHYFAQHEESRRKAERHDNVQPIFSIEIVSIDKQIDGTVEAVCLYKHPQTTHKNFKLTIKNVNKYPIKHLIIFGSEYLTSLLESNVSISRQCAYSDSPDIEKWPNKLVKLLDSEHERDSHGLPRTFNLNYEDIDGKDMYQTFELKDFEGTLYYALRSTQEV